ncbi:hypothetical protein LEP1GSC061_1046 [Leptospira wolffii serovar Khorat str. Khorat-H2]|nr:hypothetical protein LEP1GSC061_1046 [Leptospira wolffii serovar Khorat str. Khorat-H2]
MDRFLLRIVRELKTASPLTQGKAPKQTRDIFGRIFVFRIFFLENQVLGKKIHWF